MARQVERLDNAPWHALTNQHAKFAIGDERARRYPKEVSPFAGVEANDLDAFNRLAALFDVGELCGVVGAGMPLGEYWEIFAILPVAQMVYDGPRLPDTEGSAVRELSASDVPAMLELIEVTHPGPFLPRTIELGRYLSIWQQGQLAAMAGVRLHLPGYREISAVCTNPDFQRRGYARQLVMEMARGIQEEGDLPILHVDPKNTGAIALYQELGFKKRADLPITVITRK